VAVGLVGRNLLKSLVFGIDLQALELLN